MGPSCSSLFAHIHLYIPFSHRRIPEPNLENDSLGPQDSGVFILSQNTTYPFGFKEY